MSFEKTQAQDLFLSFFQTGVAGLVLFFFFSSFPTSP